MTVQIGKLSNVPAPGDDIRSPWAQDVTRLGVHPFPSKAALDAATPTWGGLADGAMAITTDTGTVWRRAGAAWVIVQTPTITQTGVVVAGWPGTATKKHSRSGDHVHVEVEHLCGAGTATSAQWSTTLPYAAAFPGQTLGVAGALHLGGGGLVYQLNAVLHTTGGPSVAVYYSVVADVNTYAILNMAGVNPIAIPANTAVRITFDYLAAP